MARRIRKTLWSRSFQRTLSALARTALRGGARALVRASTRGLKAAAKPAGRGRSPAKAGGGWLDGAAIGPAGARRYRLFRPPGARPAAGLPMLVMLHGCDQDATAFARSSRAQALAARENVVLLFPEQDRLANAQGCWNWFETRSGRAFTEAASLIAAIDQACARHGVDPLRVAIAGFSAGAGMAAFMALHYPDRFKAVAMHSGIAPGAAHSTATALSAMRGRRTPQPLAPGTSLPALLVIQGDSDPIVRASNGRAAAQLWADASGATAGPPRRVQRGARHAMTLTDYKLRERVVATLCEVVGLGHAWSGGSASERYGDPNGPDATRLVWAFAMKQLGFATR